MALPALAVIAGTAATAAYLDAKLHLGHDLLHGGSLNNAATRAQNFIAEKQAQDRMLIYHLFQDHASGLNANNLFLEFEGRSWTYGRFFDQLQRVGNWLMKDLGVRKGEMVAIDGPNSPEYLMLWFALDGVGASIAFLNCNLSGAPLVHSAKLCESRFLITDRSVEHLVEPCQSELGDAGIKVLYFDQAFMESLNDAKPIPRERNSGIQAGDLKELIYTSGTTGLPKGVIIMAGRHLNTAQAMATYLKLKPGDKFYTCLPLYHGAAQGLCITPVIYSGAAVTLGRKFSHKTFWPEVSASRANRLQYVGELCRYLVNAPPHPLERAHNVHEAWGNGMRPDVWEAFRKRFNIPLIHELYAATDGMGATFNRNYGDFSRSCIGVRGLIWHRVMGNNEVRAKIDPDTEDIVRGKDGFVIKAGVNEPGEVLHRVDPTLAEAAFKGYFNNQDASKKRWLKGVFEPNDLFFRSGDVMRVDADGRVFFVDRLGDTFRWRSENVSTNEVSDILGSFDQIAECSVYGVAVPHADGRCGCATIVPAASTSVESFDFARLAEHVISSLPRYAVPLFLRLAPELAYTGTFKIQKGQAKREGVDIDLIEKAGSKDRLYWLPPGSKTYVPFGRKDWEAIKAGDVKL
ncbi:hypothetical protein BAUCODRAFT_318665 [Baudoinia panamericana UAMH 10762]|uniref:AMP-dependent synthetase/ligase domain-containing protein n=1 Tax=Baudoinia panamericana (strain UAMH 10762) TaxID=717646 RepID=M2MX44_BAUPA|nr:uncharacterized protein BAUCODRAFT_318665 [Baudoinia panamericana UAMH 10762]EMC91214.1 hypothetical protein BAUCODRAFT_318665 [Baudoinia panamericana UAMH 10762]